MSERAGAVTGVPMGPTKDDDHPCIKAARLLFPSKEKIHFPAALQIGTTSPFRVDN
jgi:hypothetical protein